MSFVLKMVTTTHTHCYDRCGGSALIRAGRLWGRAGTCASWIARRGVWGGSSDTEEETETRKREGRSHVRGTGGVRKAGAEIREATHLPLQEYNTARG